MQLTNADGGNLWDKWPRFPNKLQKGVLQTELCPSPNSYIEVLIPNVIVFGDGGLSTEVMKVMDGVGP